MAKHTTLASLFSDIAAAIRAKTGKTDKLVADDFPTAIAGITTGVNTSDATVTAADVASGVIAYGKDGKVTGTVTTVKSGSTRGYAADTIGFLSNRVFLSKTLPADVLLRSGAIVQMRQQSSSFGDAAAGDVRSGKTFTSAAGLKVTGTLEAGAANSIKFSGNQAVTVPAPGRFDITIEADATPTILGVEVMVSRRVNFADGDVESIMCMMASDGTAHLSPSYRVRTEAGSKSLAFTAGYSARAIEVFAISGGWKVSVYPTGAGSANLESTYVANVLFATL